MSEDFRQTDGRFAKGNPGGPGRPRARERAAAVDELAGEAGAELIEVALDAAKEGQPQGGGAAARAHLAGPARATGRGRCAAGSRGRRSRAGRERP